MDERLVQHAPLWYAVRTRCNHEKTTTQSLRARNISCFLPAYESLSTWKDRRILLERPLFPGYVFVHLPATEKMKAAVVPGVAQVLCDRAEHDAIDPSTIALLQQRSAAGLAPHQYPRAGQRVTIVRGPFAGVEGILAAPAAKARMVVSIPSIARSFCVEVEPEDLRESSTLEVPCSRREEKRCSAA